MVLELDEFDKPKENRYGAGKILYKKLGKYLAEEADVQFYYTQRRGCQIVQVYNGEHLLMPWSPLESMQQLRKLNSTSSSSEQGASSSGPTSKSLKHPPQLHGVCKSNGRQPILTPSKSEPFAQPNRTGTLQSPSSSALDVHGIAA